MVVLDTDHVSVLQHEDSFAATDLRNRLAMSSDLITTTAITLEEQARSWIAAIGRVSDAERQVVYYDRLTGLFRFFAGWMILPFDGPAAMEFKRLRKVSRRVGSSDLKIAAIAIVEGATLLTANTRDFERVPGLQFQNWLDS
jgi:tRNA(fMet)-specific endonuclease VapC